MAGRLNLSSPNLGTPQSSGSGRLNAAQISQGSIAEYGQQQQNQHTLKSFTSLDPGTRITTLKMLTGMAAKGNKDAASKIQLLTPHAKDQYDTAQDTFTPSKSFSIGPVGTNNKYVTGASDIATGAAKAVGNFAKGTAISLKHTGNDVVGLSNALGSVAHNVVVGGTPAQRQANKEITKSYLKGTDFAPGVKDLGDKKGDVVKGLKETGGTVLNDATNLATFGKGGTIKTGVKVAGKIALDDLAKYGVKDAVKTVVKTGAAGGGYAALQGTAQGLQNNEDTKSIVKDAALSATVGAGIGSVGGGIGAARGASQASKIAALREQLSTSTAGGKLKLLNDLIDNYQAAKDAATTKELPSGNTVKPLGITAGASAPRDATRTPGGAVLVDGDSPTARVARGQSISGQPVAATDRAAAGAKLVDTKPNTNVVPGSPKATKQLDPLMQQWSKDKLTGSNSRGTIAKANTLNDIISHPDASPEIKAKATQARHDLIHQDAKNTLAQEHAAQTGQPLSTSHETLKAGHGEHGPLYQAVDDHHKVSAKTYADDYTPEKETPEPTEGSPAASGNQKNVSGVGKAFRSGEGLLRTMGKAGNDLADRMDKHTFDTNALVNKYSRMMPTLNKLKGDDAAHLYDVVENGATPKNTKVAQAAQEWGNVRKEVLADAHGNGRDVSDYGDNYLPHDYSDNFKNTTNRTVAARKLVASGEAKNLGEASRMLDQMQKFSKSGNKFGNFDKERMTNSLTYKKSLDPIHNYIEGAAHAISADKHFGVKQSKASELLDRIGTDGHDLDNAKRTFDFHVGNEQMNQNKFAQGLRTGQAVTKLGRAAISNATQINNTQAMAGVANTTKAVYQSFRRSPEDMHFVEKTGVAGHALEEIRQQQNGLKGRATSALMPLFNKVETFNRSSGALAGRALADNLAKKAASGNAKAEAYLRGTLKVEGPIGSKLTEEQQIAAARQVVKHTQFLVGSKDLPHWMANTQAGRTMTQFKSFSYKQQQFIADNLLKPAAKGNLAPLARYIAGTAVLGTGAYTVRNAVNGRDISKESKSTRSINAVQAAGGFGVFGDTMQNLLESSGYDHPGAAEKSAEAVAGLFGPAISTAVTLGANIKKATDGSTYGKLNLEKYLTGQVPVVGPRAAKSSIFNKTNVSVSQGTFSAMNNADKINYLLKTSDANRSKLLSQTDKDGVTVQDKTLKDLLTNKKTVEGLLNPTDKEKAAGQKPVSLDDIKKAVDKLGVPKEQRQSVLDQMKKDASVKSKATRLKNKSAGKWTNPVTN